MANVNWDTSSFDKGMKALAETMQKAATSALDKIGNEVLRLSTFEVPHDTGALQASANMEVVDENQVDVGYNKVYAARLHEHPEYHFQKGRKGHYLIDPILHNLKIFQSFLQNEITGSTT